jgi:hypothetical protein
MFSCIDHESGQGANSNGLVEIVTLASQAGTRFKVGAQTHPSLVEPKDAKLVTIPQIVLPSMDEDAEVGRNSFCGC